MLVAMDTQEAEAGELQVHCQPRQQSRPYLKKGKGKYSAH